IPPRFPFFGGRIPAWTTAGGSPPYGFFDFDRRKTIVNLPKQLSRTAAPITSLGFSLTKIRGCGDLVLKILADVIHEVQNGVVKSTIGFQRNGNAFAMRDGVSTAQQNAKRIDLELNVSQRIQADRLKHLPQYRTVKIG